MTSRAVHLVADVLGWPGDALMCLAIELRSRELFDMAFALKLPGLRCHLLALQLADR